METRRQKISRDQEQTAANFIKDIRRKTRRIFSPEEKPLVVREALLGDDAVAVLPPLKKQTRIVVAGA